MRMRLLTSSFCGATFGTLLKQNVHNMPNSFARSLSVSTSPSIASTEHVESETKRWIKEHVIGLNLCPFAKKAMTSGSLEIIVSKNTSPKELVTEIVDIAVELSEKGQRIGSGTTVIAAPYLESIQENFHEYLYISEKISYEMTWHGLDGHIQLASFHPKYQFEDTEEEDVTNYTNRSPWPLFHLLREAEVSVAIDGYKGSTDSIWQANQDTMKKEGKEKMDNFIKSFEKAPRI